MTLPSMRNLLIDRSFFAVLGRLCRPGRTRHSWPARVFDSPAGDRPVQPAQLPYRDARTIWRGRASFLLHDLMSESGVPETCTRPREFGSQPTVGGSGNSSGNGEAIMAELINGQAVLHARFDGRSFDIALCDLDLGPASDDDQVKRALARHLEVPEAKLRDYTVDRHETGNLTVRPEAVFG